MAKNEIRSGCRQKEEKSLPRHEIGGLLSKLLRLRQIYVSTPAAQTPPYRHANPGDSRERRVTEGAIEAQREKTLKSYRIHLTKVEIAAAAAKRIFAEGDSWFNYPLGFAVILH
jgi:hypothetical protein